jgi:hypothetical protein
MKKLFLNILMTLLLSTNSYSQLNYIPSGMQPVENDNTYIYNTTGWIFIGKASNGEDITIETAVTKISCTCNNKSGKCMPFSASGGGGSTSGCAGDCTNCTKSASIAKQVGDDIHVISGGLINPNSVTRLLNPNEENTLPGVFVDLVNSSMFQEEYNRFVSKYMDLNTSISLNTLPDGTLETPDGYSFYYLSIFGRGTVIVLPNNDEITAMGGGSKASCSCTNGSCSAKSKSIPLVGSVSYCEGNCSGTCTLTLPIANRTSIITYE